MRKVTLLLVAFVAIFSTALVKADAHAVEEESQLDVSMDVTYVSRYLFYGMDVYSDNDPAIQPSLTIGLWDTGFSLGIWGSWAADGGGHENSEELNYIVSYAGTLLEDDVFQANYVANWTYYDAYDGNSKLNDQQETGVTFAFPNLLGDSGIVPHYRVTKFWEASSNNLNNKFSGWVHVFGFGYGFDVDCPMREETVQPMNFTFDLVYNDSAFIADHDWSHANFSLAAPMECPMGGVITPSITYQLTMEDQVNNGTSDDDEIVFGVNYHYNF